MRTLWPLLLSLASCEHNTDTGPEPACPEGTYGCPCAAGDGCDDGLECRSGICDSIPEPDPATCGDGVVDPGEGCDDGNAVPDDGCTNDCTLPPPTCGDGVVDPGEACDDRNLDDTDACLSTCVVARCGDGVVWSGVEVCDDGNAVPDDECTNTC